MKINILTQPLFCNYGGILQNFALQIILRRIGHEPLTVNVPPNYPEKPVMWKNAVKTLINYYHSLKGCYQYPFYNPYKFRKKEHQLSFPQREFIAKYISKVDFPCPFSTDICNKYPAEAWIVGSDQIWRPWCSPNIPNAFFDFVPENVKKVVYAASFGTDKWEISDETTKIIKPLAKRFSTISVRESSGIAMCKDYLDVEAQLVLDPTLLLNADDYLSLTAKDDYPDGKYVATYVLDIDSNKSKVIKQFAEERKLDIHRIGKMNYDRFDSIESWIAGIAHSECVITDSFHGTVFSIIFGRPVKILGNNVRGNTRLDSLVKTLDLKCNEDGFYYPSEAVVHRLDEMRHLSIEYLKSALK